MGTLKKLEYIRIYPETKKSNFILTIQKKIALVLIIIFQFIYTLLIFDYIIAMHRVI